MKLQIRLFKRLYRTKLRRQKKSKLKQKDVKMNALRPGSASSRR